MILSKTAHSACFHCEHQILETTAMNPQFHIQIPRSAGASGGSQSGNQANAAGGSGSSKCHVVVSVTQVGFYSSIKGL